MLVAVNQRVNARQVGGLVGEAAPEAAPAPRLKMLMNIGLSLLLIVVI